MSTITISSTILPNFRFSPMPSAVYLRVYLLNPFVSSAGIALQASAPDDKAWYKQVTCSLATTSLTIPSFTLDSTTDGLDNTNARYGCYFYDQSGRQLKAYDSFTQFRLSHLTTPASWSDIRAFNFQRIPVVDNTSYTKLETEALVAAHGGIPSVNNLTGAITIATGSSGSDFAAAASGSTVTLNLPDAGAATRGVVSTGAQTLAGVKTLSSLLKLQQATINDTGWANTGATATLYQGADSTTGSPISSANASVTLQTSRYGGALGVGVFGYQFGFNKISGEGDTYIAGFLNRYSPDMTGFESGDYNQHGIVGHVVLNPSNKPVGCNVYGYNVLKVERSVTGVRGVALQMETVNNSGVDADDDGTSLNSMIAGNFAGGGANFSSVGIQLESGSTGATSFGVGFRPKRNSVRLTMMDFVTGGLYDLTGVVNVTNGSPTVTTTVRTVAAASNATPIVITTSAAHGFYDQMPLTVASVGGNTGANGTWYVKATGYTSTTFALYQDLSLLSGVAGTGAYTSGGTATAITKFTKEFRGGDQVTVDGVSWYQVSVTPVADASMTLSTNYAGTTATGQRLVKTIPPVRAIRPSYYTFTDTISDFRVFGLDQNNHVRIDPDGTGIYAGTTPVQITDTAGLLLASAIAGTTTNDDAAAGRVGEYVSSSIGSGSAVSLTTGTAANLTSVSLTAGDWDVWVEAAFAPGASTTVSLNIVSVSQTSATASFVAGSFVQTAPAGNVPAATYSLTCGPTRVSLASTTTIYGVCSSTFGVSTNSVYGILRARRIR